MRRTLQFPSQTQNRRLLAAALLLALFSPGLLWLKIDATTASMFPASGKVFDWENEFSANFSPESSLVVVVRAENIFAPETLRKLAAFAVGLEELDVVKNWNHLFSIHYPKKGPKGFQSLPIIEKLPKTKEESELLRREILSNPLLRGTIVNPEGTAAAFYPTLNSSSGGSDIKPYAVAPIDAYVVAARKQGIDAYLAGGPVITRSVVGHIWKDLVVLGPVGFVVVATLFMLFFRWRRALLFNLSTGCSSVIATFGFMGWMGIPITPLVSVTMVLIGIVGCTEDIHLVADYLSFRSRRFSPAKPPSPNNQAVFIALLLSSLSTALGFYMTSVSEIPALKNFAITCGTGILLNFSFTILLAPTFLRGEPTRSRSSPVFRRLFVGLLRFIVRNSTRRRVQSWLLAGAFCCASVWGITRVVIDNDFMRFFSESSPVFRDLQKLNEDFGGRSSVIVTVETHRRGGILKPHSMECVAAFQDELRASFEHVSGLTSYLREYLYQIGDSPDREQGRLSINEDQIAFCRAVFGKSFLGRYLDFDGSRTAIWIRSSISGSSDVRKAQKVISLAAAKNLPADWEIRVLGEPVETAAVSDSVTSEMLVSLLLLVVAVTAVIMFYFRSWKHGLFALVPNVLPVVATFGFMGWFGIPLGTGVFAVAMAAFGIAVDDTIHLLIRFSEESKLAPVRSYEQILHRSLAKELFPIIATSLTLIAGFAVFLLSDFRIHRETGILFVVAIGTAMLTDLFLTPLLLGGGRTFKRSGFKILQ